MMNTFNYKIKYEEYKDCYFKKGYYENGNLAIEIWNNEFGPISKVTVNPGVPIARDKIAIKDYSENEGMVDWLKSMNMIEENPKGEIRSELVTIPVYELTEYGRSILYQEGRL